MRGTRGATRSSGQRLLYPPPGLDLRFAETKSLTDWVSGSNLITFTRASSATVVNAAGALETVASNVPRFDHNPLTGKSLGLLVEEQRTNLLLRSEEFDNASWIRFGTTTLTANTSVAPDGTTTGDNIAFTSASAGTYQIVSGSASTTYTFSVWVKSSASTQIRLVINTNLSDPTTQTVTVSTGWNRFSIIKTTAVGTTLVTAQLQDTGSGNTQFDIWGAQLEVGAFPTSYIPTTTATATRSADVASITGSNFSSWYRQDEGTVFASPSTINVAYTSGVIWDIGAGGAFGSTAYCTWSGTQWELNPNVSPLNLFSAITAPALSTNASALQSNNSVISASGLIAGVDSSCSMPSNPTTLSIGRAGWTSGNFFNGTIRRLTYWPQRLPNNTLIALTR